MRKKICSVCGEETYLWKSKPPTCKKCYRPKTSLKRSKPNPVSAKRKVLLKEYKQVKEEFLKERPYCEALLPGCTVDKNVHIHHMKGKDSDELYMDTAYWLPCCNNCNLKIEELGEEAYKLGLKIRKHVTD